MMFERLAPNEDECDWQLQRHTGDTQGGRAGVGMHIRLGMCEKQSLEDSIICGLRRAIRTVFVPYRGCEIVFLLLLK